MQEMPRPNVYPILEKTLRFFFFQGPTFFNSLDNEIISSRTISSFSLLYTSKTEICVSRVDSSSRVCRISFFPLSPREYLLLTIIYLSPFANNSFFSQYHFESLNHCFQVVRNNSPYKPKRPFHRQLLHFPSFTKIMGSHVNLTISEK